jgi:hypothetical protein
VRGRNRSSSAKYSNTTSLLSTAGTTVRSNSFRVNRNKEQHAGTVTPDFCKHIKYCCLHQNLTNSSARIDRTKMVDKSKDQIQNDEFGDSRLVSLESKFNFDHLNANTHNSSNNYSDDEKSMKLTQNFSLDASTNNLNTYSKSLQHSYENFETRKCNCGKSF